MAKMAILTEQKYIQLSEPNLYEQNVLNEDNMLKQALVKNGIQADIVSWEDPDVDWSRYDMVVFRSTWNYFHEFRKFSQWLNKVEPLTQSANSFRLTRWNLDKNYLLNLEHRGVHIVPTWVCKKGDSLSLRERVNRYNLTRFVLKPAVSGGGRHTYLISTDQMDWHESIYKELIEQEDMIIQPYMHHIASKGEVSHVVIQGVYSHSIIKRAKEGDYRVQDDFGGTIAPYTASQEEKEFAIQVCRTCPELPMYARVDVVWDNQGKLALGEIELIEPELWFREYPEAAKLLAQGIASKLLNEV